jgi:YD repeat-containing protein
VTESRYDGVGNLVTLIDANGQVTRYFYDECDSLSEVWESPATWTDPNATPSPKNVTAYGYDHLGNLTRVLRAKDDSTYDELGRVGTDPGQGARGGAPPPCGWPCHPGAGRRLSVTGQGALSESATRFELPFHPDPRHKVRRRPRGDRHQT